MQPKRRPICSPSAGSSRQPPVLLSRASRQPPVLLSRASRQPPVPRQPGFAPAPGSAAQANIPPRSAFRLPPQPGLRASPRFSSAGSSRQPPVPRQPGFAPAPGLAAQANIPPRSAFRLPPQPGLRASPRFPVSRASRQPPVRQRKQTFQLVPHFGFPVSRVFAPAPGFPQPGFAPAPGSPSAGLRASPRFGSASKHSTSFRIPASPSAGLRASPRFPVSRASRQPPVRQLHHA
jgi:hypothetical protein